MVARPPPVRFKYSMTALPSSSRSTTDLLHGAAQGGLYGHGIPVGHLQQVGHRAVDVLQRPPLGSPPSPA